jgi:hypothetical protein
MRVALLIGGLLVFVFLLMLGSPLPVVLITLVAGWWPSAVRIFQTLHPSASSIVLFGLALAVLFVGSHAGLRWLHRSLSVENANSVKWYWKWTLGSYGILICALTAIGSLMLITHQLYWLSKSSDPVVAEISLERYMVLHAGSMLGAQAEENQWNSAKIRAVFWSQKVAEIGEVYQPVWVETDGGTLSGIVLIPRHPLRRTSARLMIIRPGTNVTTCDLVELPRVFASFGIGDTNPISNRGLSKP